MAASGDVRKKIMLFKLQLSDTPEPATVLKILEKLKKLDITLDVLVETGIGKAVNSLRKHKEAGEIAKSLVTGWKKLMLKDSTRHADEEFSGSVPVKEKLNDQRSTMNRDLENDINNNCLTSNGKNQDSSDENRKMDSDKAQREERKRKKRENKNAEKPKQENEKVPQDITKTEEIRACKIENSAVSKKKKKCDQTERKSGDRETSNGNKELEDPQKSNVDSRKKLKGTYESQRSQKESKFSKESAQKETEPFQFGDKPPKTSKGTKDDGSPGTSRNLGTPKCKRKQSNAEKHDTLKYRAECDGKKRSDHKKSKKNPPESESDHQESSMSFESFLNYDQNVFKIKKSTGKKPAKKPAKRDVGQQKVKDPVEDNIKSPVVSPKQNFQLTMMHLKDVPLPAALPECDNPFTVDYFERKVEKESDICEASEDSTVFTGQRLHKKMQVYSGAKAAFLPAMMSLYQQCIRTLQNNINLLHETGGVPFEILEPVLERCTPEQLLHIEECNPGYIGVTDHLWGKHCQRDFKDSKLQEYESWKEMYVRLSKEREMKLKRLTKTIVSAQSRKPQGRQLKMAFIHTVAKPPRDVRIQQELHGTAVQQPHQPKCSVKAQENRSRLNCSEPSSSTSSCSGASGSQDPRKKMRMAPMMAKSLKAFKKQLQRR
ncbi:elongin A, like [Salarias fasciatus]|uniref:elongin A, like n=1 Tax=Salarias fasciatus TaxID=181472 RepID=UPI001176C419|nr:elongin-A-like [Salarias fasciatus]